ncbi:MAG: preprotein translocase subunit SecA [Epsilonproteobacteria bacterium]|nr:preprotein translocase subunit SecA [Campylobacterota bacterium]
MVRLLSKIFGTKNDREIKKYQKRVAKINDLEPKYQELSDEQLRQHFFDIKNKVLQEVEHRDYQEVLNEVLYDVFAITREVSKRVLDMRHYDVQLIGGMVLHEGKIAEMKTGEGKTLVATLPVVLNAILGKGVHVVTVNDYLASRDANLMRPIYEFLGFSVGYVIADKTEQERKEAYGADITYGTNNEFGFDYLRDNMAYKLEDKVQRGHFYAIVDEVDSILIDEARTPLIISGPANRNLENYEIADKVAKQLQKDVDFTLDEKHKITLLTEEGIKKAEELFGVDNLYLPENAILAHHLDQALKANYLFQRDVDYIVRKGEVLIIDEFTGRISEGRRFSEGLHQALEAKEGVEIQEESQTLAEITYQNYFRLYEKLAGMTGTAQTEATEFAEIYGLEVISIPTNKPVIRKDLNDLIYKTEEEKFEAVINKIKELHKKGQPILVGTASIEKSEILHKLLKKANLPHTVLNAKNHEKEAHIIEKAGQKGAITVATNMAGRGVDIKLGDGVKELGGLAIIGTERHESRRIDNQLRGRGGRQGDPGMSQFYLSLEDNLLRIFGSDKIKNIMDRLGIQRGEHIESKIVTRSIENAQKKVENMHFESRKYILKYDDVANEQRKVIYKFRNDLMDPNYDIASKIADNRKEFVEYLLARADIYPDTFKEDYDLETLVKIIEEYTTLHIHKDELQNKDYEELNEYLQTKLSKFYENKMSVVDKQQREEIERSLYIQVLDENWREHLYQMDILKTGIGLRGYNQKDPLVEYKKESFNLFNELIEKVKTEYMRVLHSLQFQVEDDYKDPTTGLTQQEMIEAIEEFNRQMEEDEEFGEIFQSVTSLKKPKRNDPCPCGSGEKYKNCCGKSGPKKGILAGE